MRNFPQGSACLYVFIKLLQHEKDLLTKRRNTGLYVCLSVKRLYTTCASFVKIFFVNFYIIFPAIYCIISHKFCQYFFVFLLFFCRSRAAAIYNGRQALSFFRRLCFLVETRGLDSRRLVACSVIAALTVLAAARSHSGSDSSRCGSVTLGF